MKLTTRWLGQVDYEQAHALQKTIHEQVLQSGEGVILGLEHPSVITLGIRAQAESDLLVDETSRKALGLSLSRIDRGGQATLHSPGQLVIYPILPLRQWRWGARQHVEMLQDATRELLAERGVTSRRECASPGVFTEKGKIAFIGIRIRNGVTLHGLALNVHNDLSLFSSIRSCGVQMALLDRLADHGESRTLPELFTAWVNHWMSLVQRAGHSIECGERVKIDKSRGSGENLSLPYDGI